MKVSVIIPLFNKEGYIFRAIKSVLLQTFDDFEIVIVDDGSTDNSINIVNTIKDSRIRVIRQINAGAAAARNAGIRASRGEWIAFLDADDTWRPENLQSHLEILERNPDLYWSFGLVNRRRKSGRLVKIHFPDRIIIPYEKEIVLDALSQLKYICTITVIIKKVVFDEVGYFDSSLKTAEDLDMWLRIALRYPNIVYNSRVISEYNIDIPDSLTNKVIDINNTFPHVLFARKHLHASVDMIPEREKMVRLLCLKLLDNGIKKLLLEGHVNHVKTITEEFKNHIDTRMKLKYIILSMVPKFILKLGYKIKINWFNLADRKNAIRWMYQ